VIPKDVKLGRKPVTTGTAGEKTLPVTNVDQVVDLASIRIVPVGQVPDLPSANFDRRIDEKPSGISIFG